MIESKSIIKNFFVLDFDNYKNAQIISIRSRNKRRVYIKEHDRRLSTKEFMNFYNEMNSVKNPSENYKELFKIIENRGFKKQVI